MQIYAEKWEESYARHENFIFYPKEEYVKFLNRFVRKKIGINNFIDILDFNYEVRGLDYGCGIGRLAILMKEFGINAFGVDISSKAIQNAQELAEYYGYTDMIPNFQVVDGTSLPFDDKYFDFAISEAVFDSMHFNIACNLIKELDRVTKSIAFISLISGDDSEHFREFAGEEIVKTKHEHGTIQSYYNYIKIKNLISNTNFKIKLCRIITEESVIDRYKYGRYYVVLSKK